MKRPKICFLLTRPEPHRISLLNLIAQQCEADFEILYCTKSVYQEHVFDEKYQHVMTHKYLSGVEWHGDEKNQSATLWNPVVFKELIRAKPDLLILAGYSNPTMILAFSYAWIFGVRYGILNESHLLKKRTKWKLLLKKLFLPLIFKNAFVNFSTGVKAREYLECYGANPSRIFTFPNTCDIDFFSTECSRYKKSRNALREQYGLKHDSRLLLYVGRLIACKGLETLLSAMDQLRDQKANIQLLIVGDGPLRQELEKSVQEKKLLEDVIFTGFVANLELPKYYAAADVFVLPSLEETWGVVVTEALACGLPMVLSDQVGAGYDFLHGGCNGVWFQSGDENSLLKAINKIGLISGSNTQEYTYLLGVESFRRVLTIYHDGN